MLIMCSEEVWVKTSVPETNPSAGILRRLMLLTAECLVNLASFPSVLLLRIVPLLRPGDVGVEYVDSAEGGSSLAAICPWQLLQILGQHLLFLVLVPERLDG